MLSEEENEVLMTLQMAQSLNMGVKLEAERVNILVNLIEKNKKEIEKLKKELYQEDKEELKPLLNGEFIHKDKIRAIIENSSPDYAVQKLIELSEE